VINSYNTTVKLSYLTFCSSLVTTRSGLVQQTPTLAVWKFNVRSKNKKENSENCQNLSGSTNLLTSFVRGRYTRVFLLSFPSQAMCANSHYYLLQHFLATHPNIQHSAECSAVVQWACRNLWLQPNVI